MSNYGERLRRERREELVKRALPAHVYSIDVDLDEVEFGSLPPVLQAQLVKRLKASLAKETDPAKKAKIQAELKKYGAAPEMSEETVEASSEETEEFATVTKSEAGGNFPASDYAYVPDATKPSTWKLRLTKTPGGYPDPGIVGAAAAALGAGGFRGQKVQIPEADLAGVKAKVRAAWKKANPDKDPSEMPDSIK